MSRNEWEEGVFKLSSEAYRKFTADFAAGYNEILAKDRTTLERLRLDVIEAGKGIRGKDWSAIFDQVVARTAKTASHGYFGSASCERPAYPFATISEWEAKTILVQSKNPDTKQVEYHAPRAIKASTLAPKSARSLEGAGFEDGGISLDRDSRTVRWCVPENNHAIDHAREHPLGMLFWKLLRQVQWTRGTGGRIVSNDEYNEDDRSAGGGANYVKERFGPLGEDGGPARRSRGFGPSR